MNSRSDRSFASTRTNELAISACGWYPHNRNLLMDPMLRATMKKAEIEKEKDGTGNVHLPFKFTNKITDLATTPIYNPKVCVEKASTRESGS